MRLRGNLVISRQTLSKRYTEPFISENSVYYFISSGNDLEEKVEQTVMKNIEKRKYPWKQQEMGDGIFM